MKNMLPILLAGLLGCGANSDSGDAGKKTAETTAPAQTSLPAGAQISEDAARAQANEAEAKGDKFTNSVGIELIRIEPGEFEMGSSPSERDRGYNEDQVDVALTNPFYLGKTEVTQGQWQAVMGRHPGRVSRTCGRGATIRRPM